MSDSTTSENKVVPTIPGEQPRPEVATAYTSLGAFKMPPDEGRALERRGYNGQAHWR